MVKCEYCKKKFGKDKIQRHYANCVGRKAEIDMVIDETFLREKMITENLTANAVAYSLTNHRLFKHNKENRPSAGFIIGRCKKYNIPTPNISDSNSRPDTRDKIKKTCLERYGVENVNTLPWVKAKKTKKALKKYGTKNVFQSEVIKKKSRETCLRKYGVRLYSLSDEYYQRRNYGKESKPHRFVMEYLKSLKIQFLSEKGMKFQKYNSYFQREYSPRVDILLCEQPVVIEVYGNYWHCNPKQFKPDDVIEYLWRGKCLAKDVWEHDRERRKHIRSFGYKVIELWEDEIVKGKREIFKYRKKLRRIL